MEVNNSYREVFFVEDVANFQIRKEGLDICLELTATYGLNRDISSVRARIVGRTFSLKLKDSGERAITTLHARTEFPQPLHSYNNILQGGKTERVTAKFLLSISRFEMVEAKRDGKPLKFELEANILYYRKIASAAEELASQIVSEKREWPQRDWLRDVNQIGNTATFLIEIPFRDFSLPQLSNADSIPETIRQKLLVILEKLQNVSGCIARGEYSEVGACLRIAHERLLGRNGILDIHGKEEETAAGNDSNQPNAYVDEALSARSFQDCLQDYVEKTYEHDFEHGSPFDNMHNLLQCAIKVNHPEMHCFRSNSRSTAVFNSTILTPVIVTFVEWVIKYFGERKFKPL